MVAKVIDAVLRLKNDFSSTLKRAEKDLAGFQGKSKMMGDSLYRTSKGLDSVSKAFMPITAVAVATAGASVKAFSDFETAMVGVKKTTDLTNQEMESLEKNIVAMTREIPASATEIAGVAEAAGQLGISKENLESFTKTMVMMGTATNMSSEEAAVSLAKMANITQMNEKDFDRLGSTVVTLGNNLATTESDIVAMGLRLSATGKQVGLTEAGIMALSGTLSSLGIEAEAGGTAMSQVMVKINKAVGEGGKTLNAFAKASGKSAEEFARAWESSPDKALVMLTDGLAEAQKSGQNLDEVLKTLGITGIRETDTMKRLAGSGDMLSKSFDMAGEAWEKNEALANEAEQAYKTFASSVKKLKSALFEVQLVVAKNVLPTLAPVVDKIRDLAIAFTEADPKTQQFITKTVALVAAIGPVAKILSIATGGFGKFFDGITRTIKSIQEAGGIAKWFASKPLVSMGKGLGSLHSKFNLASLFTGLGTKLKGLPALMGKGIKGIGPAILGGLGKLKAIPALLKGLSFKGIFDGLLAGLKGFGTLAFSVMGPIPLLIGGIVLGLAALTGNFDNLRAKAEEIFPGIGVFFDSIKEKAGILGEKFMEFIGVVQSNLGPALVNFVEVAKPFIRFFAETVLIAVDTFLGVLTGVIEFLTGVFYGDWNKALQGIKTVWESIWKGIGDFLTSIWEGIKSTIGGAVEWITSKITGISKIDARINVDAPGRTPRNARGTSNWKGGPTWVGEEGPEILDLPRGSRVHTATTSRMMANQNGKSSGDTYLSVAKLADQLIVREEADIDRIIEGLYKKLRTAQANKVVVG